MSPSQTHKCMYSVFFMIPTVLLHIDRASGYPSGLTPDYMCYIGAHTFPCWMASRSRFRRGKYIDLHPPFPALLVRLYHVHRHLSASLFPPNQPHPFSVGQHNLLVQYLTSISPLSSAPVVGLSTHSWTSHVHMVCVCNHVAHIYLLELYREPGEH